MKKITETQYNELINSLKKFNDIFTPYDKYNHYVYFIPNFFKKNLDKYIIDLNDNLQKQYVEYLFENEQSFGYSADYNNSPKNINAKFGYSYLYFLYNILQHIDYSSIEFINKSDNSNKICMGINTYNNEYNEYTTKLIYIFKDMFNEKKMNNLFKKYDLFLKKCFDLVKLYRTCLQENEQCKDYIKLCSKYNKSNIDKETIKAEKIKNNIIKKLLLDFKNIKYN